MEMEMEKQPSEEESGVVAVEEASSASDAEIVQVLVGEQDLDGGWVFDSKNQTQKNRSCNRKSADDKVDMKEREDGMGEEALRGAGVPGSSCVMEED
ncbi:hypothetical protein CesoFtcFv8_011968 [Champsocephalus esox]|uniref:Uncharacterized protein n=1 Tax=Champsocephalus esox TaxID=159716 RepID=A0AAN8GY98_9TELE|nr:hypothetical protein CesoFtcFv8_011968 [Champsocephalus esox]